MLASTLCLVLQCSLEQYFMILFGYRHPHHLAQAHTSSQLSKLVRLCIELPWFPRKAAAHRLIDANVRLVPIILHSIMSVI